MNAATVRVLHVEDERATALLLAEELRDVTFARFEVHNANRLATALSRLGREAFAVALLDLSLPDSAGIETVERVRAAAPDVPLVVMTGREDETVGMEAIRRGAQDYLVKSHANGRAVARAILYAIDRKRAEIARLALQARVARAQAAIDTVQAMAEGIVLLQLDGTILSVNPALERLAGLPADAFIGRNLADFVPRFLEDEEARLALRMLQRLPSARVPGLTPVVWRREDGWLAYVVPSISFIPGPDGRPATAVLTLRDITELRAMEIAEARARAEREESEKAHRLRLQTLATRLSVTEERNRWRISRQIHDTVVQSLSLANIRLGMLREEIGRDGPAALRTRVDGIRGLADDAINQSRALMSALTPPLLYEIGLGAALSELAEGLEKRHGVPVRIEAGGEPPDMPAELRGFLFESAQELIVNALKHAQAGRIVVRIESGGGTCTVHVEDDGRGVEHETEAERERAGGGFGLFSIRVRAEGLGGSFGIGPAPGGGTRAFVTMPLPAPAASAS